MFTDDTRKTDIAILGAGVAGLTAAHDLRRAGHDVVVIDRAAVCGGTHRSTTVGCYTFDAGSIFFEENHPLFEMFDGLRARCPAVYRKQGRVTPAEEVRHYPFEPSEVLGWSTGQKVRAAFDLARQRLTIYAPRDAEAFCQSRLGDTAYRASGLKHYITRFHQEDPAQIDVLFCQRRMKFVMREARLRVLGRRALSLLVRRPATPKLRRPLLVRPRDGFEAFYGEAQRQLETRGVRFRLNSPVAGIARCEGGFHITTPGGSSAHANRVVGAIPLDTLHHMVFGRGTGLESIDLLTLFVSVSRIPGFVGNVLFNFHPVGRWKRATIYSRIYGKAAGRHYFAVEITCRKDEPKDPDAAFAAFRRDVTGFGIFADDLTLEGFDIVDDAYPLYHKSCAPVVEAAIDRLSGFGITPVGRQGQFAYLPVSALVVSRTRKALNAAGLGTNSAAAPDSTGGSA